LRIGLSLFLFATFSDWRYIRDIKSAYTGWVVFFFFPFWILLPFFFILIALRIGTRIFRDIFKELDGSRKEDFRIPGSGREWLQNLRSLKQKKPQSLEAQIFRLAYKLKGRVTLSDIVLETGLSLKEAEDTVTVMVDGLRVSMEVDDRGLLIFEFPEIISRFKGET